MMFPGGGHWSRKGVWGCAALKTPFSRLSCHSQGSHFKQKSQFTRPPFEKIWKFKPLQPQFSPNFSSQAPKFGNFQLTSPQIWKFSAHKPPFSEANYVSSQAPHLGNPGRTPLPEKKLSAPPPGMFLIDLYGIQWLWRSACPPVCLAGFKGHQWIWPIDPPWNRPIGLSCNLVWDWQTGLLLELVSVWKPWIGFT